MKRPRDIDPDEVRELVQRAFYLHSQPCETCGRPNRSRGAICGDCEAIEQARENCPHAIARARTVAQAADAMRQHARTCPVCRQHEERKKAA